MTNTLRKWIRWQLTKLRDHPWTPKMIVNAADKLRYGILFSEDDYDL